MLSDQELQKAKSLKEQGYTADQIKSYIGAERMGRTSMVHTEKQSLAKQQQETLKKSATWRDIVAAPANFLIPDATEVFGDIAARRGVGLGGATYIDENGEEQKVTAEMMQQRIDEPTKKQLAGAVLQTAGLAADVGITVGTLGAGSAWTVGRNMAYGGLMGYVYDVGEDMIEQENMVDTLTPGIGTAFGVAAPAAFAGLGAGARKVFGKPLQGGAEMIADDTGRAAARTLTQTTGEAVEQAVEPAVEAMGRGAEPVIEGAKEMTRSVGNTMTRVGRHMNEAIEDKAERSMLREGARKEVQFAIDEGVDTSTILRVENATKNPVQKKAYQEIVLAATENPSSARQIPGEYVLDQYKIARANQDTIGTQLGEARRALGTEALPEDVRASYVRGFIRNMGNNGVQLKPDGKVNFTSLKYSKEQENTIRTLWAQANKVKTPQQVDEFMQFMNTLEYQTNKVDNIKPVYIQVVNNATGETTEVPMVNFVRNTFDAMLEKVDTSGNIAKLRRDYSIAKSVTTPIEDTWLKGLDIRNSTDDELATQLALRLQNIDKKTIGATTGTVKTGQYYRALDKYSRSLDYTGPEAADLTNFISKDIEPLFPEMVEARSFKGGIIGGIRSTLDNVLDFGRATQTDKQKAIRQMLDLPEPAGLFQSIKQSFDEMPNKQGGLVKNPLYKDTAKELIGKREDELFLAKENFKNGIGTQNDIKAAERNLKEAKLLLK